MATITKRGNSFRATISLYKKGEYKRETKTFSNKKDAELNCTPKVGQKKSNFWGVFV